MTSSIKPSIESARNLIALGDNDAATEVLSNLLDETPDAPKYYMVDVSTTSHRYVIVKADDDKSAAELANIATGLETGIAWKDAPIAYHWNAKLIDGYIPPTNGKSK